MKSVSGTARPWNGEGLPEVGKSFHLQVTDAPNVSIGMVVTEIDGDTVKGNVDFFGAKNGSGDWFAMAALCLGRNPQGEWNQQTGQLTVSL